MISILIFSTALLFGNNAEHPKYSLKSYVDAQTCDTIEDKVADIYDDGDFQSEIEFREYYSTGPTSDWVLLADACNKRIRGSW